jgi:hypothetical protein
METIVENLSHQDMVLRCKAPGHTTRKRKSRKDGMTPLPWNISLCFKHKVGGCPQLSVVEVCRLKWRSLLLLWVLLGGQSP